eukprot:1385324-Prymnesium_polylepis.1
MHQGRGCPGAAPRNNKGACGNKEHAELRSSNPLRLACALHMLWRHAMDALLKPRFRSLHACGQSVQKTRTPQSLQSVEKAQVAD